MNQVSDNVQSPDPTPKTARGRMTRQKLLDAAENEFGERGFHAAAINRITENAGVAMGTFYVHFPSKEAIFRALVAHLGHQVRRSIAMRVAGAANRLEAERRGLQAYIEFTRTHRNIYRIVNEAEFIAPDAYRAHYESFVSGYVTGLREAERKGEIAIGEPEPRAWALIGASVFLGMRYGVWDDSPATEAVIQTVGDLIEFGLSSRKPAANGG
ncbi:MAG TPA: TetR family transcriptional regulator [Hyphomonadaceae bacterium]|nr:TetR family transcriptional regulator [Hyphomonadaceae bacterium]